MEELGIESLGQFDRFVVNPVVANGENLKDISHLTELAYRYSSNVLERLTSRSFARMKKYLVENDLKAVPLDKGAGYCITKKSVYLRKPNDVLVSPQFQVVEEGNQRRVEIEEEFNRSLKLLKDANKSNADFDEKSRSCGAQPARLYGLAKLHKQGSPLRPILSFPGSCYENLSQSLSRWLEQLPGANIETSSQNERSCCQR